DRHGLSGSIPGVLPLNAPSRSAERNCPPARWVPRMAMKPSHVLRTVPVAALIALGLLPVARAAASASQVTIMQDDNQIVFTTDAHRAKILDEMKSLGADVVKLRVDWRSLSPHAN